MYSIIPYKRNAILKKDEFLNFGLYLCKLSGLKSEVKLPLAHFVK